MSEVDIVRKLEHSIAAVDDKITMLEHQLTRWKEARATLTQSLAQINNAHLPPQIEFKHDPNEHKGPGRSETVQQVIEKISGEFTAADIKSILKSKYPKLFESFKPNTLSSILFTFVEQGKIRGTKPQIGRVKARYVRIDESKSKER